MFVNPTRRILFGRSISTQFDPKVDLYKVLEATDKMSQKEIKQQYYKLAHKYHPDKAGDSAAEKFKQISGAWEIIGDPDLRKQYDLSRIA
jgi:DnaJ-class molecular chaperone